MDINGARALQHRNAAAAALVKAYDAAVRPDPRPDALVRLDADVDTKAWLDLTAAQARALAMELLSNGTRFRNLVITFER